jgi:hypothetical protein
MQSRADWIRLYPLPLRWMGVEQQFKKFDLIEVEVRRESRDTRPESYRPDIDSIRVLRHLDDWTERQPCMERVPRTSTCSLSAAAAERHEAPSLGMVDVATIPAELRAPRFIARYEYYCRANGCPRHVGQILDWELTALQGRLHRELDMEAVAQIERRFRNQMFAPGRRTSFFMGNFEDARKRSSFSVLGVYYPPEGIGTRVGLFDLDED